VAQPLLAVWGLQSSLEQWRAFSLQNHTAKSRCATQSVRNSRCHVVSTRAWTIAETKMLFVFRQALP
jgi:hypothetical protein